MITDGFSDTAIAMQTRCFIPPESSCGYLDATSVRSPTEESSPAIRSSRRIALQVDARCERIESRNWSRMRRTGLSEFIAPGGSSRSDRTGSRVSPFPARS